MKRALARSSLATLVGLIPHYLVFYLFGSPLWTETIAEWIMARTPSAWALWILGNMGPWAKPFALTGGLAALGAAVLLIAITPRRWLIPLTTILAAVGFGFVFHFSSITGQLSFWVPAAIWVCFAPAETAATPVAGRRQALVMLGGTVLVAMEGYLRDESLGRRLGTAREVATFTPPPDTFETGLVRKAVTPVDTFYVMSKNTVDPALDARDWRLQLRVGDRVARSVSYAELVALPQVSEYITLRCISNTLQSDLMGTALWTGVRLRQLLDPRSLSPEFVETAVIGVDGHGDSFPPSYLFSDDVMLAVAMNGRTLTRAHGFPVRLIVPRYYGFKNVKWIHEISLVRQPYIGTWPKLGYTKEPVVHTASHIDKIMRTADGLRIGGVSFAGDRGIAAVEVRADQGPWQRATLERQLSRFTWTRWAAAIPTRSASHIEARAQDGSGGWQESAEGPLFPDGVKGPTIRRLS